LLFSEFMDVVLSVPLRVWAGVALTLGLIVGSFLNVVIHRLPRDESIAHPPSHCPQCQTPVRWYDNFPLLSYLWLRGRCRGCRARISPRYPAIELVTGLLFAAVALRFGPTPMAIVGCAFAAALVATAAIDFDHQIIPDEISVGGLAVALVAVPFVDWLAGDAFGAALARSLAGAALGGGLLWIVGFGHARVSSALGREFEHWPGDGEAPPRFGSLDYWTWFPGVGFGDVKLLAMIGAVLGPFGVLETIVLASLVGLAVGLLVTLSRRAWNTPFGFGPAIAVGALLALLAPDPLAWLPGWR
jgi:leader peptidase (prepilin peptidase)/N-methyltransferase